MYRLRRGAAKDGGLIAVPPGDTRYREASFNEGYLKNIYTILKHDYVFMLYMR